MNTLIFAAGIVVGAIATFAFIFIVAALATRDSKEKEASKMSEDLVKELWHEYIREMKDDGK